MRPQPQLLHPVRFLVALFGGALVVLVALVSSAATGHTPEASYLRRWMTARADTDSVALGAALLDTVRLDSTRGDSLALADSLGLADSLALPDTGRASFYLSARPRTQWLASPFERPAFPLSTRLGSYWKHELQLDSTGRYYIAREVVGKEDVRYPYRMDPETYRRTRMQADLDVGWRELMEQRQRQRASRNRGGLGFNIVVPGGQQSAFTTIFGKPEVDLRVNGQADIKAGFDYRKSDQQVAFTGRASQIDPDFKQDLRLGITGTIGDKLEVNVNWDTNNQFDYQNQLKLQYTGYEDEIIQHIEAGNVFLSTPSQLIRGGQSLFGIKSEFQIGGLNLTTVASQQEGQSNSLSIEGGSETTEFDLKPTDYDDSFHFFLSYYFRNRWEKALQQPPNIIVADNFERITDIEVWRLQPTGAEDQNVRQVVAMVDRGDPVEILQQADGYTGALLPSNDLDQYTPDFVSTRLRPGSTTPADVLTTQAPQVNLGSSDFQVGKFKKLIRGTDYEIDDVLGYISLSTRLQDSEALAVAYRYVAGGRTYQVGEFSTETGGASGGQNEDRLVLKLVRPVQLRQPAPDQNFNPAAWYLEMRNIYRLPGRSINMENFDLHVYFEPPGKTASKTIAEIGGQQTLLQMLGLDRVNADGAPSPDDQFDAYRQFTIDPAEGRLIFPYLEPFGNRMARLIDQSGASPEEKQARKGLYVFQSLYKQKKENARRDTQLDVYRIRGSYKGSAQDFYDLRAYAGLIEGSVRVTSGGSTLTEGADYVVDYQGGTVTITNPAYLTSGRDINITYEQNSFFNLQKKTLLGARADYAVNDQVALGATLMQLSQKSPIDKFRIGEEPISNTIWGLDGAVNLQPRWLTQAVDALPFIQTRAPSSIKITGEFAQLRPGASETIAFERTRKLMADQYDRDFKADELRGISYLDDFEGFENTFSLKQPGAWRLSAAPDSIGRFPGTMMGTTNDSLRTTWRSTFGWYQLNANILSTLGKGLPVYDPEAILPVDIQDVFPNKDVRGEVDRTLQTLDIYYNPHERGPYNYTGDLRTFLNNPQDTWGGMTQRLPEGYTDFSLKNIEFLEFVFRPFPENSEGDAGRSAKLYVDLGSISEDVIPDGDLNNEDGISLTTASATSLTKWGREPTSTQNNSIDVNDETQRTEDLGLDGLASYDPSRYETIVTEQEHFKQFLSTLDPNDPDPRYRAEVQKALNDPSGDDYHYFEDVNFFGDTRYFPAATFQQYFTRWFPSQELNSFEAQQKLDRRTAVPRGNSRLPDSEDLNLNSTVDSENSYFQYELPLSKAVLDSMATPTRVDDYVVTEITDKDGRGTGWYQVRIPMRDYTRKVGEIQDFSLIESIRVWTTGHQVPVTLRFATFELVGSQWQKSQAVTLEREDEIEAELEKTHFTISSINNEENPNTYKTPIGTIISQTRLANGGIQNAREQAMVLRAENLMPGKQRAIYKTQAEGVDLLKYSNLRMFVHMHGQLATGDDLANLPQEEARSKVRLFIRLGANETNDYYEYEQPLTPSREPAGDMGSDELWQTNQMVDGRPVDMNSVNLVLGALNQLKVERDKRAFPTDSLFWHDIHNVTLSPSTEEFAPPGTRVAIRGNPSLQEVNSIVIGIRNPADSLLAGGLKNRQAEYILEDVTMWVNELRVAGYDETNGRASLANADIQLADLGSIKASFKWQEDGFGGLGSSLGEREQNEVLNWSVTTDFNLDKFIPERYGWTLPVSFQAASNTSTPRYSPQRGDIRLTELIAQIEDDPTMTPQEKDLAKQEAYESAQTANITQSISTRLQKTGSRSRLLRNTIDGISFNYSYTDAEARTPTQRMNDSWRWTSALGYRLNIRKPRTVKPFWFLGELPIVGALGDLQFNYLPQSLALNGTANRNFSQTQDRPRALRDTTNARPLDVAFPIREQHALAHRRTFSLQYNPFQFLNLSYDTNTSQSLNALGADTLFTLVTLDSLGREARYADLSMDQAVADGSVLIDGEPITADDLGRSAFELRRLDPVPAGQIVNRIFSGHAGLRTDRYEQRFSGTFRPNFTQSKALNWINIQDIVYGAQFSWQNGTVGRPMGASVGNQVELRGGITLRPQEFWRKFGFYQTLEAQEREAQARKQAEQREREQARRRRQEERERRREQERKEKEAAAQQDGLAPAEADQAPAEPAAADPQPADQQPEGKAQAGQPAAEQAAAEEDGGGFPLPLPDPGALLRKTALALTGIRDFSITYTGSRSSTSSNVGRPYYDNQELRDVDVNYSLLDAFRGSGPSLGYRFGLQRVIGLDNRVIDQSIQVSDALKDQNKIQARTALNPNQSLQINLNWSADWGTGLNYSYRRADDGLIETTETSSGNNRASIWAFGADYLEMLQHQIDTYQRDVAQAEDPQKFGDANGDGRVVLTNASVVADFQRSFLKGLGTVDGRNLLPFPMPGWSVSYSGISKWPLINRLVQNATLRHGYTSDYSTDFRTNVAAASNQQPAFNLGSKQILFSLPEYEVGSVRINERYQPLIGLDLTWKGRVQTNVAWNKSTAYSLSTTGFEVSENKTSELSFTGSFQRQGMSLPFLPGKRLNNRISFSLTVSRSVLGDQRYSLRRALTSAIDNPEFKLADALAGDNISVVTASTRLTVSPQVSYQFSNRVSASFTLRYENFQSEDSRQPSQTTINGGFNIRVSIAN